ncbi:MAG: lipopolysaccharide biosynthesis protein [Sedimentisphaerales bacterium]
MKKVTNSINWAKPYALNVFWSNLNQGLLTVSAVIISVVFTRFGSKELYGHYAFVIAIFSLFSIISISGVGTVIFRAISQGYDCVYRKATEFSFMWSLLGIPLIITTGVFFYLFRAKILGISLIACALFFPFVTSLHNWTVFLKAKSDFRKLFIYNSIKLAINLIGVIAAIVLTKNLILILLAYFLVNSGFDILYHFKSLSALRKSELDPQWKRQGYALTIMDLSSQIFGQVDVILIAALLPIDVVAMYCLVMRIGGMFFKVIRSTVDTLLPKLFKSEQITIQYFYKFFLLSFLIPVILYPVIKYIILLLYGQEYLELVTFTRVYLTVIPFFFLHLLIQNFMVKYHLNAEINLSKVISIISVVFLYAVLIPLYGIWGGIVSSMLYFVIQLIINSFLLKIRAPKYIGAAQLKARKSFVGSSCYQQTL